MMLFVWLFGTMPPAISMIWSISPAAPVIDTMVVVPFCSLRVNLFSSWGWQKQILPSSPKSFSSYSVCLVFTRSASDD